MKYQIEHDGIEVKMWFQSETIGKTLQEVMDEIQTLGLIYKEEDVPKEKQDSLPN